MAEPWDKARGPGSHPLASLTVRPEAAAEGLLVDRGSQSQLVAVRVPREQASEVLCRLVRMPREPEAVVGRVEQGAFPAAVLDLGLGPDQAAE